MSSNQSESPSNVSPKTPLISPDLAYEDAFAELEETLARLEKGDLPLEESLALFERGSALIAFCNRKLEDAELRVRQWAPGDQTAPFDGWQES